MHTQIPPGVCFLLTSRDSGMLSRDLRARAHDLGKPSPDAGLELLWRAAGVQDEAVSAARLVSTMQLPVHSAGMQAHFAHSFVRAPSITFASFPRRLAANGSCFAGSRSRPSATKTLHPWRSSVAFCPLPWLCWELW